MPGNLSAEAQGCSEQRMEPYSSCTHWCQVLPRLTAFKVHNNFIPWVLFTYEDTELDGSLQMAQQSQIRVSVALAEARPSSGPMGSHLLEEGARDSVPERGSELGIMPQRVANVNHLEASLLLAQAVPP